MYCMYVVNYEERRRLRDSLGFYSVQYSLCVVDFETSFGFYSVRHSIVRRAAGGGRASVIGGNRDGPVR